MKITKGGIRIFVKMDSDIELAKPRYNINGGGESEEYENI